MDLTLCVAVEKNQEGYTYISSPQTQPTALITLLAKRRETSQRLHLIFCAREGGTWRGTQANFLDINLKEEQQCGMVPVAGTISLNIHALSKGE